AIAGAGVGLAAKEAIAFESAMANVRKVVDFKTPGEFKELTADLKNMSREIPVSLDGLAKIAEAGGQMGIASKDIRGFTDVVAKMSSAFKITPDEAGEAVGRLMNIFKLTVPETQRLGDAINHLGNNTNAIEKDILNVMNRTGGMAKVFGLTTTEAAALGTAFLALGRPPEIAATGINALMLTLQTAPTRETEFKQALDRIGFSAEKLAADVGKNPQKTLMNFLETLKSLDKQTQSETLVTLFGRQYSDDLAILLSGLDTYKKTLELVSKETNFAGSMQKEFNERIKTTESQIQLAKNALTEAGINLGSAFLPVIVAASKGIASLAHGVAELADRFPVLSATAISAVTAFAGFGALRLAWSLLRAQVVGLIAELGALALAAGRLAFTPLGAVLTAAGIAAYALSKATESSVQPLLDNAAALGKSREATAEKIKTLEDLKNTLETTTKDSKEHIDAEEKLATILPKATITLDEQGRILAKVGSATRDNTVNLSEYLDLLKKDDRQTLALQLDTQSRALIAGKKELASYTEGLRSWYGIGVDKAQTETQKFLLWLRKLTGAYDEQITAGAELRRQLEDTSTGLKSMLANAKKAGMSVDDLGQALDKIHADSAAKGQIIQLFRAMTAEAGSASGKVGSLADSFKQFSIAISGPVAAAKKGLVDAIGAADTQLGKYNEALSQHREKLKIAVDDETNSWKALAKASEVAFEDATRGLDEQYEKRRTNYEKDSNAFRYYVRKETDTFIVEEKRQADAKKFSEKAMLQATNAIFIEESTAKLAETNRYLGQALALSQKEYQTKIDNAKRLKLDANRIDEERLQSQRSILERVESAYRQNIDKLIAEEKRHRDAAKQLAEERKNFNESVSDRIQNIAEKGMDPVHVYASRQRRIVQEQVQAEEALQQGNYELARKHAEKMISLAEQTSDEVKQGDMVVVGSKAAAARSIEQMQKAAKIENQAFREEADAHTKAADSLKEKSETAEKALAKIRDAVQEVDAALAKDHTMIINANIEN
ncbi:MAG: phage tail tape measure protein, partial [Magnetococcales bacterium]|nr:phage tail tape measure protein [Magnetococcales bacterium]